MPSLLPISFTRRVGHSFLINFYLHLKSEALYIQESIEGLEHSILPMLIAKHSPNQQQAQSHSLKTNFISASTSLLLAWTKIYSVVHLQALWYLQFSGSLLERRGFYSAQQSITKLDYIRF
ncbi:hypothetical protein FGO68_gene15430 [Halteria grandinella]|uniref:Uncharacterized protein n=1 Tax=Halteria grandinella TaxID=5974 RepID=A0A8J8SYE7_HALGN|nr:hypothetical protein FGO68_gene15430 [Halteria grandinella]